VAFKIRRLSPEDDRSMFQSGNIDLDRFFQRFAGQNPASAERLTTEEIEADRSLCVMLGIEPDALPADSLDELRHLWA